MDHALQGGRAFPPYIPQASPAPLHKLCNLALLWHEKGFTQEAGHLAHWLAPLQKFPTLWCPEKEYDEGETQRAFSLLSAIAPIPGAAPDIDLILSKHAALTRSGHGTSLGMIRVGDAEIRAFGPQSNALQFGIKGTCLNGWTQVAPLPEVWLEMKSALQDTSCTLDLRFVGLKPDAPISLAFYIKAPSCQIGHNILKPKSLQRFVGEASSVKLGQLTIESERAHKVQAIPLAGGGCFWDCEFLVTFEIHPLASQVLFEIS